MLISSDDLTRFLIGSGAGFSVGFISGIFFVLKVQNPEDILLRSLCEILVKTVENAPSEAKAGVFMLIVGALIIVLFKIQKMYEILAGGVLGWVLGFAAGAFLVSSIQVLVGIAVIILIVASKLGWLKK